MKKILLISLLIISLGFILVSYRQIASRSGTEKLLSPLIVNNNQDPLPSPSISTFPTAIPTNKVVLNKDVLIKVPYMVQAPFGQWSDPRQQDGCEEAVSIMAVRWVKNQNLEPQEALDELLKISDYELKSYGNYQDASLSDTNERIIKGYFNYTKTAINEVKSDEDIIRNLQEGKIVIVPANGQALNNPYFTQPGPERHMVLITGYDSKTNEFITNDPGISQGFNYRYPVEVLFNAIRDYLTGYHQPLIEVKKVMLVIEK